MNRNEIDDRRRGRVNQIMLAAFVLGSLLVAGSARSEEPAAEPRAFVSPRIGLAFPGEMTPRKVRTTSVGFGFAFMGDGQVVLAPHFALGAYLHVAGRSFDRYVDAAKTVSTSGPAILVSGGAIVTGFITPGRWRLGLSLLVGYDLVYETLGDRPMVGHGLGMGAALAATYALTRRIGLTLDVGFIGQVAGAAQLPADVAAASGQDATQGFSFYPASYLTLGPSFSFGP